MLPTVTALASVDGRHHSRSASCQAEPAGGGLERLLWPNEWTVTRLPRGVTPTVPRATAGASGACDADGTDVGAAAGASAADPEGSSDAVDGMDAATDDAAAPGEDDPPQAAIRSMAATVMPSTRARAVPERNTRDSSAGGGGAPVGTSPNAT